MAPRQLFFNGILAPEGRYLEPPCDPARLAARIRGDSVRGLLATLGTLLPSWRQRRLGTPSATAWSEPREDGWGLVLPAAQAAGRSAALAPLLRHRADQLGAARVRELLVAPGDDFQAWLGQHGVSVGSLRPERLPYFLLLAGDPSEIP